MNNKILFLVGLPNSGKSTYAEKLALQQNAIVISSDNLREKIFGNSNIQKKPHIIFNAMYEQAIDVLSKGKNVIMDATNISRKRRLSWIKKFKDYRKEVYYFNTSFHFCQTRNSKKKQRQIDNEVMTDMYKNLHVPMKSEGWDEIHLVHAEPVLFNDYKETFETSIKNELSYDELFDKLNHFEVFRDMYQFNQENAHHKYPVCMHTYQALHYINENYHESDKYMMQLVALFHDSGKPFCKIIKDGANHASYFGHENVSAQLCINYMHKLGYEDDFILKVVNIIQLHMKIWQAKQDQEIANELYQLLGDEYLWKLYMFGDADTFAKG